MKNAMSGGKGKVSRYTQKFKQSYNRFVKIGDNEDEKDEEIVKLKRMEEWGRMRSIYKFLKFQKNKYIGSNGTEITALEKMEENISITKDKDGYESAINCFKQSENDILSEKGSCIPEEDYIKGDTEAPDASDDAVIDETSASVVSGTDEAQDNAVIDEASNNNDTPLESSSQATTADVVSDDNSIASENDNNDTTNQKPSDNDVIAEASENDNTPFESASEVSDDTEAPAPVAEAPVAEVSDDTTSDASVVQSEDDAGIAAPVAEDSSTPSDVSNDADANAEEMKADADAEAMKADTNVPADLKGGGRSKRRQKSSRRRGKSMKSKKGRKTRRKHRAGRH